MLETVRARFSRGSFKPLEEINLPEGEEVSLSFRRGVDADEARDALTAVAGAWKGAVDGEALKRSIYASRKASARPAPRMRSAAC